MPKKTLTDQATTLVAETTGYLAADHIIRRVHAAARAQTAAAILAHFPAKSDADEGFRRRLKEATTAPAPSSGR